MKYISILLLACSLSLVACGGSSESGVSMYVTARSGLIIRSEATTNSEKLGLVPMGESVSVLETAPDQQTIGGKTGHWQRIEYNGTKGWAFGGFLSATPVEKLATNQIRATFTGFEFGDTASYYFIDESGKRWTFKDNRSKLDFHVEDDTADQGFGVNRALMDYAFIITYKKVRQPLYPDGPEGDVLIITAAKKIEE